MKRACVLAGVLFVIGCGGDSGLSLAQVEKEVARQAKAQLDVPKIPGDAKVLTPTTARCVEKETRTYLCDVKMDVKVEGGGGVLGDESFAVGSQSGQVEAVAGKDSDRVIVTGLEQFGSRDDTVAGSASGQDSDAKSNARNMVSWVESCYASKEDYSRCDAEEALGDDFDLRYGSGDGEVEVVNASSDGYEVVARSLSGNSFTITKEPNGGTISRTCEYVDPSGGCKPDGTW